MAAIALLSAGGEAARGWRDPFDDFYEYDVREKPPRLPSAPDDPKPLTKRQKRRLRGRATTTGGADHG